MYQGECCPRWAPESRSDKRAPQCELDQSWLSTGHKKSLRPLDAVTVGQEHHVVPPVRAGVGSACSARAQSLVRPTKTSKPSETYEVPRVSLLCYPLVDPLFLSDWVVLCHLLLREPVCG